MYKLEKYQGRKNRFICPNCGDKFSFVRYVDENNNPLNKSVGRCNHESSCGYHYTPRQYFRDNPTAKEDFKPRFTPQQKRITKPLCTIPFDYVMSSKGSNSGLIHFMGSLFDSSTIERLIEDYHIGFTKNQDVIFWQVDRVGRVRTGKIQGYNRATGKRIKAQPIDRIDWTHSRLKKQGILPDSWELSQCLYGEHLLIKYPDRVVAVVEGEKNALFGSAMFPDYVWVATGSKQGLQPDKLKALRGRKVVIFPDADAYVLWLERSKLITFCTVVVSDLINRCTTQEQKQNGYDITDYIIEGLSVEIARGKLEKST